MGKGCGEIFGFFNVFGVIVIGLCKLYEIGVLYCCVVDLIGIVVFLMCVDCVIDVIV